MRLLASRSILTLRRDGRFTLTRLGRALRSDDPNSVASMVTFVGSPQRWAHWSNALHSVRTGRSAMAEIRKMPVFEYLDTDPEFAAIFNNAMTAMSTIAIETAFPAYDFTDRRRIVDIGGGHGALLSGALRHAPQARGVLYDLPAVVAGAGQQLTAAGVSTRCDAEGGSFFDTVPAGGDAHLMKNIIHDWDDEKSLAILRISVRPSPPTASCCCSSRYCPKGRPITWACWSTSRCR